MSLEMSTLVTFARTKGFVYQGSEIYGGLANSWDYGPLGILLKDNIKNLWTREFVQKRKDMVMLDAAIMMNPNVWVASGHVGSFSDPLMECRDCNTRHRADKLVEEALEKDASFPVPANALLQRSAGCRRHARPPVAAISCAPAIRRSLFVVCAPAL